MENEPLCEQSSYDEAPNKLQESAYTKYIKQLWELSAELEHKLDAVLRGISSQDDKSEPETTLHSELERTVDRFRDIVSRIKL